MSGVLNINIAESVEELKSFSVRYFGAVWLATARADRHPGPACGVSVSMYLLIIRTWSSSVVALV